MTLSEPKCTGIYMMSIERVDQVLVHGYDLEHDKQHSNGELIEMASYYLSHYLHKDSTKDLVKAGALIAAEIDRRQGVDFMESPRQCGAYKVKTETMVCKPSYCPNCYEQVSMINDIYECEKCGWSGEAPIIE